MTRSSANNITHGGSFPISACSTSMMSIKISVRNPDSWCNPTPTWKYSVSLVLVDTRVSQSLYISCIIVTYPSGTPFFQRHHHINSRCTRSYAFSRSTKTMWSSLFTGLNIWVVDAVARGASRFENLLAPQKLTGPPKNLLAPSPKPNLCDEKNICVNVQFEQCIIKIHD